MQSITGRATAGPKGTELRAQAIAASTQMIELLNLAERAAASDAKVLITGESGVGRISSRGIFM